jgi:hypothetical protein
VGVGKQRCAAFQSPTIPPPRERLSHAPLVLTRAPFSYHVDQELKRQLESVLGRMEEREAKIDKMRTVTSKRVDAYHCAQVGSPISSFAE